jgi:hypothetical protein
MIRIQDGIVSFIVPESLQVGSNCEVGICVNQSSRTLSTDLPVEDEASAGYLLPLEYAVNLTRLQFVTPKEDTDQLCSPEGPYQQLDHRYSLVKPVPHLTNGQNSRNFYQRYLARVDGSSDILQISVGIWFHAALRLYTERHEYARVSGDEFVRTKMYLDSNVDRKMLN